MRRINAELATVAETAATDAASVLRNAKRKLAKGGKGATAQLRALVAELESTMALTSVVVAQTRSRLGRVMPDGATRVVSLHDRDARPIAKGRLGKPVEFGYKAQVVDNADGIVVDHTVMMGNPADAPQLVPAIARIKDRFTKVPKAVTADRGYGEAAVEAGVADLGVAKVVIPRKGRPNAERRAAEGARPFRRLIRWRTGCEGRISHLKHAYAWDRTLLDGLAGAQIWCGLGVLAHNSVKIATLIDAKATTKEVTAARGRARQAAANEPPPPTPFAASSPA